MKNQKGLLLISALIVVIAALFTFGPRRVNNSRTGLESPEKLPENTVKEPAQKQSVPVPNYSPAGTPPQITADPMTIVNSGLLFALDLVKKIPEERASARLQVQGLSAALFVSDYLLAEAAKGTGKISQERLLAAFTNSCNAAGFPVTENLFRSALWSMPLENGGPSSYSDHYSLVRKNNQMRPGVEMIEQAIASSGIDIRESELKLDCIRFASLQTEMEEFYGKDVQNSLDSAKQEFNAETGGGKFQSAVDPFPNARSAAIAEHQASWDSLKPLLQWRLKERYGYEESAADQLAIQILAVRINGASPAELRPPALTSNIRR